MLSREGRLGRAMQRRWTDAETAYHAKILESLPQDPDALLLDVGCDDGEWTEEVRRKLGVRPRQVYGLEIVDERAALARRRGFVRLDHFVAELRRVLAHDGVAVVCTENLASWHNVAAVALGYQPFSLTNVSSVRPIGNRFALHAGEPSSLGESWQHVHVLTLAGLCDVFAVHGFGIVSSWGTGYYPFGKRVASVLAARDPRHAHFVGVIARRSSAARAGRGGRRLLRAGS